MARLRKTGSVGFYGVALYEPKTIVNLGGILRNAHAFGAAFVSIIGGRYRRESSDVSRAEWHLPIYEFEDMESFLAARPRGCEIVRVEVDGEKQLPEFTHRGRAIYLFGGEDRSVPKGVGERSVRLETSICLNLATTTGIVMYDRSARGVSV